MENIESNVNEQIKPDIEAIKSERESYIAEYIEAHLGRRCMCGLKGWTDYKCKTCEAEFETLPGDAKYCRICSIS